MNNNIKLKKNLVEKPCKEAVELLKKCEKNCPFFNNCFYLSNNELCQNILGSE